ncbi:zinc-binding dehydrogenase [Streptomyces sp. NBC_01320]|uniref:zinc-binding dehydrogenase n=1 Tax=Streptomyces sp. NBC_01320 TaxID=2903824 RepID=UPI002E0F37E0|nr:zinc-binding dehydrogenase [Streptomyces sp. NBC_01320]
MNPAPRQGRHCNARTTTRRASRSVRHRALPLPVCSRTLEKDRRQPERRPDRVASVRILREVAVLADDGKLSPLVDPRRFTLRTTAEAHGAAEGGSAKGKVVIGIGD